MKKLQPGIWIALTGLLLVVGFGFSIMKGKQSPQTAQAVQFTKHHLWQDFISEGVAVGDVNNDGQKDILSGPYWFEAPEWSPHEMRTPQNLRLYQRI
jgi:hypothetical protein